MCSMWHAAEIGMSDLDYYAQFNPEPPEDEEIEVEIEGPEIPDELEAQWVAADEADGLLAEGPPLGTEIPAGTPSALGAMLWDLGCTIAAGLRRPVVSENSKQITEVA